MSPCVHESMSVHDSMVVPAAVHGADYHKTESTNPRMETIK